MSWKPFNAEFKARQVEILARIDRNAEDAQLNSVELDAACEELAMLDLEWEEICGGTSGDQNGEG